MISPILFNLVIDYVVNMLTTDVELNESGQIKSMIGFYADDGYIGSTYASRTQELTRKDTEEFSVL